MSRRSGFTLIELSVVISIIALIIASVVIGQSLIRNAQLRAVATDVAKYTQNVSNFRDKYLALPGDFPNAINAFQTPGDAGYYDGSGGHIAINRGGGNGRIEYVYNETYLVWQHLYFAGMFDVAYSGLPGPGGQKDAVIGTNVPPASLPGGGYTIISVFTSDLPVDANYFPGINYGHMLQLGTDGGNQGTTLGPLLTVDEALSLDTKMDDGLPATGKIMTLAKGNAFASNCASTAVVTTAIYDITKTGSQCSLLFLMGF